MTANGEEDIESKIGGRVGKFEMASSRGGRRDKGKRGKDSGRKKKNHSPGSRSNTRRMAREANKKGKKVRRKGFLPRARRGYNEGLG